MCQNPRRILFCLTIKYCQFMDLSSSSLKQVTFFCIIKYTNYPPTNHQSHHSWLPWLQTTPRTVRFRSPIASLIVLGVTSDHQKERRDSDGLGSESSTRIQWIKWLKVIKLPCFCLFNVHLRAEINRKKFKLFLFFF